MSDMDAYVPQKARNTLAGAAVKPSLDEILQLLISASAQARSIEDNIVGIYKTLGIELPPMKDIPPNSTGGETVRSKALDIRSALSSIEYLISNLTRSHSQ